MQKAIEFISNNDINNAMEHSTRQYFTGDLKQPQALSHIRDLNVESGINVYPAFKWEAPHYHTTATEYCYMLEGETKYINLSTEEEHHFYAGDFYILHRNTPYLQKCSPGCKLLFFKIPGMNDKELVPLTEQMRHWCEDWDTSWK